MKAYVNTLNEHRIFQSMSRKGNCHDNSVMENFFGIMKQEMYYGVVYYSFDELKDAKIFTVLSKVIGILNKNNV